MNYLQFREQWHRMGCFNIYQVRAWCPDFDRSNITRWVKRGYLVKLRQDWYAFSELLSQPDAPKYVAGAMYSPSYVSLHAALAYYGIIPEAVSKITSVTSRRTTSYCNAFGEFSYQTVKPELFFGYKPVSFPSGGSYLMAHPEKAIVDLLYLYPQYNTEESLLDLRFDEYWMQEDLNLDLLMEYTRRCSSKSLQQRIDLLIKTYRND
ncbi:MAG: hypothetical protein IJ524_05235 [Bacteroidales bacterium]|nr:hypothetical protein [Bacteroidales bacterium]